MIDEVHRFNNNNWNLMKKKTVHKKDLFKAKAIVWDKKS